MPGSHFSSAASLRSATISLRAHHLAIGLVGISQPLVQRFDAVREQHRRLGRDHDRAEPGPPHDQALLGDDPQRLAHGLAAGAKPRHQFGLGRQQFADRSSAEPDFLLQLGGDVAIARRFALFFLSVPCRPSRHCTGMPDFIDCSAASNADRVASTSASGTGNGLLFSMRIGKGVELGAQHVDRGVGDAVAAAAPLLRRIMVVSSSTSAEPSVPNTCTRQ